MPIASFADLMRAAVIRRIAVMPLVSGFGIRAGSCYAAYRHDLKGRPEEPLHPSFLLGPGVWVPVWGCIIAN